MKKLVIVESPNKIQSISKYLGHNYDVRASVGHIVTLPSTGEHNFGVDMKTWEPQYKIDVAKKKVVDELKKAASQVDEIYVATDPDREGEAIADNLVHFLKIEDKYKRIRFNEITENAIKQAIDNPTTIDKKLVDSQVARRILDRIIGYKLSSLMKSKFLNAPINPSAGRVQSVALKLVIDREKEIEAFVPIHYATLDALIEHNGELLRANYYDENSKFESKYWSEYENLESIHTNLTGRLKVVNVSISKKKEGKVTPFKQATLYKRADSTLGLSSANVQRVLQHLYEQGYISYPRTDSTRLSENFVKPAQDFIKENYGDNYVAKEIKGSAGAQDAHEAIRPTSLNFTPQKAAAIFGPKTPEEKLYSLIWIHTIQALMSQPEREILRYDLEEKESKFKLSSSKVIFDGYYKASGYEASKELPILKIGDTIDAASFQVEKHETQPPARYNDGSLIEKLDDIGVGRPSTFASTINILKQREYVILDGKAIKPTTFGRQVCEKLYDAFPIILNEKYTSDMELKLDEISEGKHDYRLLLDEFWSGFENEVQSATMELEVTKLLPISANKQCPKCTSELIVRTNKRDNSRFFACPNFPNCKHTESDPTAKKKFFKRSFKTKKVA